MPNNFIFMACYIVLSKSKIRSVYTSCAIIAYSLWSVRHLLPRRVSLRLICWTYESAYPSSLRLNTRRVSRGRGTDAQETATVPTFLMVGKLTQRTIQVDPEYAVGAPISPSSKTMTEGKSPMSPVRRPKFPRSPNCVYQLNMNALTGDACTGVLRGGMVMGDFAAFDMLSLDFVLLDCESSSSNMFYAALACPSGPAIRTLCRLSRHPRL